MEEGCREKEKDEKCNERDVRNMWREREGFIGRVEKKNMTQNKHNTVCKPNIPLAYTPLFSPSQVNPLVPFTTPFLPRSPWITLYSLFSIFIYTLLYTILFLLSDPFIEFRVIFFFNLTKIDYFAFFLNFVSRF